MAVTQYFVLYKFMHPSAKKSITNTTSAVYGEGETSRFAKSYDGAVDTDEVLRQKSTENEKYDMLFMYDGVWDMAVNLPDVDEAALAANQTLMGEKFERCNGEAWFVASKHPALAAALNAAKPIAKSIGKTNVRVVKNVPLDITVGIE